MKCPYCGCIDSKVVDSRPNDDGTVIRRRRECTECGQRMTTYEKIEEIPIMVIKKNSTREQYDRKKVMGGILRACEKRPISMSDIEKLVDGIEAKIQASMEKEVSTSFIGEEIMSGLRKLDHVAYVRFASVYREFKDVKSFYEELRQLGEL
ncbi:MAG: transcriptional regulator NrdR [Bacillota bacterium]|nr:transcriptional regulator NrdR [Bacillota bacterium]